MQHWRAFPESFVICVADDIIVYRKGDSDDIALAAGHDTNLHKLLDRCQTLNIKLNKDKSVFRATEIPLLGHRVTSKGLQPDPDKINKINTVTFNNRRQGENENVITM